MTIIGMMDDMVSKLKGDMMSNLWIGVLACAGVLFIVGVWCICSLVRDGHVLMLFAGVWCLSCVIGWACSFYWGVSLDSFGKVAMISYPPLLVVLVFLWWVGRDL